MLSPSEHTKLVRVLDLTRSDIDGEALAAVRAAQRILAGRSYADVWPAPVVEHEGHPRQRQNPPSRSRGSAETWRSQVNTCLCHEEVLTVWDRQFLRDLIIRSTPPTPKQRTVLSVILERVEHSRQRS